MMYTRTAARPHDDARTQTQTQTQPVVVSACVSTGTGRSRSVPFLFLPCSDVPASSQRQHELVFRRRIIGHLCVVLYGEGTRRSRSHQGHRRAEIQDPGNLIQGSQAQDACGVAGSTSTVTALRRAINAVEVDRIGDGDDYSTGEPNGTTSQF